MRKTIPRIVLAILSALVLMLWSGCGSQQAATPTGEVPVALPTAPVLDSPADGAKLISSAVKLEWNASASATSYGLQVAPDSDFTNPIVNQMEITGTYYELASGLKANQVYYWRINASNVSGASSWSSSWSFRMPIFQLGKIAFAKFIDFPQSRSVDIFAMNEDGSNQIQLTRSNADGWPSWSPDGTKIALTSKRDGNYEIYVMNADGSNQTRLTDNPEEDAAPSWSPDGTKIALTSKRDGNYEIYVMNADGSNQTRLTNSSDDEFAPSWSPDGTKITFCCGTGQHNQIYVMDADGSNRIRLTNNAANDWTQAWSPDGTKIAFSSNRDGNWEIYIMNADGSNQMRLTNSPGLDGFPAWSPDSTKIAFLYIEGNKSEIYTMNADGSNRKSITPDVVVFDVSPPAWR